MKKSILFTALISLLFSSCSTNEEGGPNFENNQVSSVKLPTDSINPILKEFLENLNASRADVTTSPADDPINPVIEFYDSKRNLSMQAVETTYNGLNVIAGAYYIDDIEDTRILMLAETQPNEFTLMAEDGEPILELSYDSNHEIAYCSRIISRARLESYCCGAAMGVLGVEVGMILAIPTGGLSAVGFAILWSMVSTTACA